MVFLGCLKWHTRCSFFSPIVVYTVNKEKKNPIKIYLSKVVNKILEKHLKHVQS